MGTKKNDIAADFQGLFKKTVEINTRYYKEGSELVSELIRKNKTGNSVNFIQPDMVAKAITSFAKLNLEHYQNVLDLGLNLTRQTVSDQHEQDIEEEPMKPAFILSGSVAPGKKIKMDFLLDNIMNEQVKCQFRNSAYYHDSEPDVSYEFHTEYSPQSFLIAPGESKKITIEINVESTVAPGDYTSRVEVLGFEPLFFLISLNISEIDLKNRE